MPVKKTTSKFVLVLGLVIFLILLFPPSCKLIFLAYDAIARSITDPPAGQFLYEDEHVLIQTGEYKTVSIGGNGDNDTYHYFIRHYLSYRDEIDLDSIRFETDPYWDDFYIYVKYKIDGRHSLSALESVKDFLYPDGQVTFTQQSDGLILVKPPLMPEN